MSHDKFSERVKSNQNSNRYYSIPSLDYSLLVLKIKFWYRPALYSITTTATGISTTTTTWKVNFNQMFRIIAGESRKGPL